MKLFKRLGISLVLFTCAFTNGLKGYAAGTVTNCTDFELRAAIAGGGVVTFACSGIISLTNVLTITNNTFLGVNGYHVVISGAKSCRLFQVNTNANLEIRGLKLYEGYIAGSPGLDGQPPTSGGDGFGGAILNLGGAVTLIDCTITDHIATGGDAGQITSFYSGGAAGGQGYGGALCNLGGTLNLTNCTFSNNHASGGKSSPLKSSSFSSGSGGDAMGGAIYSQDGTVNLDSTVFTNNLITGGPGLSLGGRGAGGALFLRNSALFADQCLFVSNSVVGGDRGVELIGGGGGGDGLGGGYFLTGDSSATAQRCFFLGNSAQGGIGGFGAGGNGQGGAVFNAGQFDALNSSFYNGGSTGGCCAFYLSGPPNAVGQGGAIYSTNLLTISGCTFASNCVAGRANGSYHSFFYGSPGEGGAVWSSGQLRTTNSTFAANFAVGGSGTYSAFINPGGAAGGALRVAGGQGTLVNVTLSDNRAVGSIVVPDYGPVYGAGLSVDKAAVSIFNSIVSNSGRGGDTWGAFVDGGYNICSDDSTNFSALSSLTNTNPRLGLLANNGGPTATMVLLPGSPGLDVIPFSFPGVDQRGISRPKGTAGDIGAVEGDPIPAATPQLAVGTLGEALRISFTAEQSRIYRLLSSTDTAEWVPIGTNSTLFGGHLQFVTPINLNKCGFFRVVTP